MRSPSSGRSTSTWASAIGRSVLGTVTGRPTNILGVQEIRSVAWREGALELIDQRRLPNEVVVERCADVGSVARAIRELRVRGAPAIGVAAAYGIAIAALSSTAADPVGL